MRVGVRVGVKIGLEEGVKGEGWACVKGLRVGVEVMSKESLVRGYG